MFNKKNQEIINESEEMIRELREQLAAETARADANQKKAELINELVHAGLWCSFFNEKGENDRVEYSDEFRRMINLTRDEFPDSMEILPTIVHPDDIEPMFASYGAAVADRTNRTKYNIDYRLNVKGIGYKWFHATGEIVRKPNGDPVMFVGTFTDIDEKRRTDEEKYISLGRQAAIDKMMLEGTWSMDLTKADVSDPTAPMVFSDQFKHLLGYTNSVDFPDVMSSWITKIHPDDVGAASSKIGEQLADKTGSVVFDMVYRMLHKDGKYRWFRASSEVVWSPDRTPLMVAGTILDVTEQKENREKFEAEMAPNIEALSESIDEISTTVDEATEQMQNVADRQSDIAKSAELIEQSVDRSMEIIQSIQHIASQTNLLSLNASIEAARAGDAGRGFAVVASEVSNLAQSTKETTNNISNILTEMNVSVKEVMEKITQINDSITSQSAGMEEINATVGELQGRARKIGEMANQLYN